MLSRWPLAAALAAGLTLGFSMPASAAATLDANVTAIAPGDPVLSSFQTMAQTFKVVHPGQLSEVDLHYGNQWFASAVKAQIWTVSGGSLVALKSTVLAAGTVPFTADWHTFTLTTRVTVDAGQTFAIVLTSGSVGSNRWSYNTGARYSDGTMLVLSRGSWSTTGLASGAAFLFRAWVETGPQTPSITADRSTGASADEATRPTMTGTYTNPAGGAITLGADSGQVTDLGAGKWSWTGDVYDEDTAPAAVSVKLTDSLNQTATATFPLTISRLKPTASIATSGLRAAASTTSALGNPEGSKLILNGSAASSDPADQAGVWTYQWTATRNGLALPEAGGAAYPLTTADEGDTFVVTLKVIDDGGVPSDPVSVTVVGNEIKPSATITSIALADSQITFVAPGQTLNFAATYSDPAPESHTYRWNFGDGGSATTPSASHAYAAGGTYPVTLTFMDDEGVAGTATATVKVLTPQQALAAMIALVQGTSLSQGQQNSLIAKLNAASDAWSRGDKKTAGNQLNAFLNELEADLKAGKISATAYNALRADAHAVQGSIGTYNRFLEWWPLPA